MGNFLFIKGVQMYKCFKILQIPVIILLLVVAANAESIYEVQYSNDPGSGDDCYPSDYNGQVVTVEGIVTGIQQGSYPDFYIQHPDSSEWNGIFIYDSNVDPQLGDYISVTGEVDEYYGLTEIKNLTSWDVISQNNPVPSPVRVRASEIMGGCEMDAEIFEGVLVKLFNVTVLTDPNQYGEFWVTDSHGDSCLVDDNLYQYGTNQPDPPPEAGMHYTKLIGLIHYAYGEYRLLPRGAEDFVAGETPDLFCDVWPHYPPVEIPPTGARMTMDGLLQNFTDSVMVVDVWADAEWVTGGITWDSISGCCQYTAHPGMNIYPYEIGVPARAPEGEWRFWAYAGLTEQGLVYDSGCFTFHKVGYASGGEERIPNEPMVRNVEGWVWYDIDDMIFGGVYDTHAPIVSEVFVTNTPNPFNPSTDIRFELPSDGKVTIDVYNIAGQRVSRLADGFMRRGPHQVEFDGSNVSSGIYFYRIEFEGNSVTRRMTLLK
ncbi:MAG: T9SS type A sorting domain-containing protein [candidate division Zixibacteria bacterium]|nr:T9SS type A sorting domain-containing protein [candidate division Zixibacteria bacterium]